MKNPITPVAETSRRRSVDGYKSILGRREKDEAKAQAALAEQKRLAEEQEVSGLQSSINSLCDSVQASYTAMVNAGKDMSSAQQDLERNEEEVALFLETSDELYARKDFDESQMQKMAARRLAYYLLPVLDCFFAFMCIYPIVTSKVSDLSFFPGSEVAIGAFLSVLVGYGASLLGRMGVASLDDDDRGGGLMWLKYLAIAGSVLTLPLMYVISEVAFNGGRDWTYSGSFAFVSLVIQLLIITGFKRQQEAMQYFSVKAFNDRADAARAADEAAIRNEKMTIEERIEGIIKAFDREYRTFTEKFRALASARDQYLSRTGREPKNYLNQMVIYFGDLVCFRREAIPLHYTDGKAIQVLQPVNFQSVGGCEEIYNNDEFVILDYMLQRSYSGVSLSETLRSIGRTARGGSQLPPATLPEHPENNPDPAPGYRPGAVTDDGPDDGPDDGVGGFGLDY